MRRCLLVAAAMTGCERRPPPDLDDGVPHLTDGPETTVPGDTEDTDVEVATPPVTIFDTGGPPCAGSEGDTGLIVDVEYPTEGCTIAPVPRGTPGVSVLAEDIAMARVIGDRHRALGFALRSLGDIDRDGYGEIAVGGVGVALSLYSPDEPGEVWILSGPLSGDLHREDAATVLTAGSYSGGDSLNDGGFLQLADLTADGHRDLVVNGTGYAALYVVPLPAPAGEHPLDEVAAAVVDCPGGVIMDYPATGDVDGDGFQDLSFSGLGAPGKIGGVSVIRGPFSGVSPDPRAVTWSTYDTKGFDDPYELSIGQTSGRNAAAAIHDVDGDGRADILVGGDRFADIAPNDDAFNQHGGYALFVGGDGGGHGAADAVAMLYGTCSSNFGSATSRLGDVTGDCRPDVGVAAVTFALEGEGARGAIFILSELHRARGMVPLADVAGAVIVAEEEYDVMEASGYFGDLDKDGFTDLVVGARGGGAEGRGAVYLFMGPVRGVLSAGDADIAIYGSGQDGVFGAQVRSAGDVDGDGILDLMVGAYTSDFDGALSRNGAVYVFSGADLLDLLP